MRVCGISQLTSELQRFGRLGRGDFVGVSGVSGGDIGDMGVSGNDGSSSSRIVIAFGIGSVFISKINI